MLRSHLYMHSPSKKKCLKLQKCARFLKHIDYFYLYRIDSTKSCTYTQTFELHILKNNYP